MPTSTELALEKASLFRVPPSSKFVQNPTLKQIGACCKVDLLAIATHFKILAPKRLIKEEFRALVSKLVELEVIVLSGPTSDDGGALAEGSSGGDTLPAAAAALGINFQVGGRVKTWLHGFSV